MNILTYNTCEMDEKLNEWIIICTLFFHQYILTWIIYVMLYLTFKFAFIQNDLIENL